MADPESLVKLRKIAKPGIMRVETWFTKQQSFKLEERVVQKEQLDNSFKEYCDIQNKLEFIDETKYFSDRELIEDKNSREASIRKDVLMEEMEARCVDISRELLESQEEVTKLRAENRAKDDHIKRLKRHTQDFEDEALNAEESFLSSMKQKKEEVKSLKQKIIELANINNSHLDELKKVKSKNEQLERDLKELSEIRDSMLTSIETLTAENELYLEDLKRTKQNVFELNNVLSEERHTQTENSETAESIHGSGSTMVIIRKLVVLTDEYCRYLYEPLKKKIGNNITLQLISKHGASFSSINVDSDCYIDGLTSNDYVMVAVGSNNESISLHDVTLLANKCFYTNLIFCTSPARFDGSGRSFVVEQLNNNLRRYASNLRMSSNTIGLIELSNKFYARHYCRNNYFLNI
ncbi:unnamed protein product [Ceutorhynchus assimilis]|uniref:Uncharacterized protein n=1 Tax=Ceutorhynchus assimilis TaxID=467358 RepID=A0A9N9QL83_9CUCU|nr:unnamed protein product [Ceutorhynchus assimilis]